MIKLILIAALALQGTPYRTLNCYSFINKTAGSNCGIAILNSTCSGRMTVVRSGLSLLDLVIFESDFRTGDVAQFHGGHVAMYLGNGIWIDSSRKRNGVAQFSMLDELASNDRGWYGGPIQVVRWKYAHGSL